MRDQRGVPGRRQRCVRRDKVCVSCVFCVFLSKTSRVISKYYLLTYLRHLERVRRHCRAGGVPRGRRPHRASVNLVPLLLTGVRLHPPGRTDKHLCRCFGAPARQVFVDHLICISYRGYHPWREACASWLSRPQGSSTHGLLACARRGSVLCGCTAEDQTRHGSSRCSCRPSDSAARSTPTGVARGARQHTRWALVSSDRCLQDVGQHHSW